MAQLLLITEKSLSDRDNRQAGDIVGVYSDEHVFSEKELGMFDVVKIKEDRETIALLQPETRPVVRAKSTNWEFEEDLEHSQVWRDRDGNHKEIVEQPRLAMRYEDGKVVENYSRYAENDTTLIAATIAVRE